MLPDGRATAVVEGGTSMTGTTNPPDGWVLPGYAHVQLLGSGAGGHVWLAEHRDSGTLVAVKYLMPTLHAAAGFREAYRAEAELLATLDSPHVTRLYEYVEGPPGAAIVMEAVEGSSLRALMKRERAAASPEAALCILKGSLLGLAAAHEAGVVHRDFKPANVLVTPAGMSKLVDFGIAARRGEAAAAAGTPLYMAPEQFQGGPASPAADVYAATVTFFECVTGERPFPGANAVELMAQHALGSIPAELAPEPLRPLILRGMAKDPFDRPASAREFLAELEAAASGAYGREWEERGRQALATALALLPLLLLAGLPGTAPVSSAAVATTVLGEGEGTGKREGEDQPGHHGERHETLPPHRPHRRRRHVRRAAVGSGIGLICVVGIVAAAAAYASHHHTSARHDAAGAGGGDSGDDGGSQIGALTDATTLITPSPSADAAPSPSPSRSHSPSPSASTSTAASTSAAATTTSATPTRTTQSPTPSPSPQITDIAITSVTCPSTYTAAATLDVKSNGGGGTVTVNWMYENSDHTVIPVGNQIVLTLTTGKTDQTLSPADFDFTDYQKLYPNWGIEIVGSSPNAQSGSSPQVLTSQNNCQPVIQ